jgi:hypothetical protein
VIYSFDLETPSKSRETKGIERVDENANREGGQQGERKRKHRKEQRGSAAES